MQHQIASEGCWLYSDPTDENLPRYFSKDAYLPDGAPELPECTNEEKERYELEWEVSHNPVTEQENQV